MTLALAVHRGFAWSKVLPYIAAQFAGAFVASAVVYFTYREAILHIDPELTLKTAGIWATYPQDYLSNVPGGLIDQIVGTALLMMVIFAISDVRNMAVPPSIGPIVVGATVFVIGMTYGLNSGYAINPARDLGRGFSRIWPAGGSRCSRARRLVVGAGRGALHRRGGGRFGLRSVHHAAVLQTKCTERKH